MPVLSLNIISITTYNGRYAYFLGGLYGYVYWNSILLQWENASGLGTGTVYNYLPSTALLPITSPTEQWINLVPGFEIYSVSEGDCPPDICYCYKLTASDIIDGSTYSYITCDGVVMADQYIDQSEVLYICARQDSVVVNPLEVTVENQEVECVDNLACQPTTTTTTSTTTSTTSTTSTTTTTTAACDCLEYFNNTGSTANDISYTDCSTGNPVGPISIPPNQSFCSQGNATGTDVGILSIISFNCCP